jgi:hypothetical protein
MALTDIILDKGKIIVILSNSYSGMVGTDVAFNFGIVQRVNDLCDSTTVGASVNFDITKAKPFQIISGQTFYLVDEEDISSSEVIPL